MSGLVVIGLVGISIYTGSNLAEVLQKFVFSNSWTFPACDILTRSN